MSISIKTSIGAGQHIIWIEINNDDNSNKSWHILITDPFLLTTRKFVLNHWRFWLCDSFKMRFIIKEQQEFPKAENKMKQSLRGQIFWNQKCAAAIHLLTSIIFRLEQRNEVLELKNYLIDFTTQSANQIFWVPISIWMKLEKIINLFQYPARSATKYVKWWSLEAGDGYFFPYHLFLFAHECILNEHIYQEHLEGSQGESKQEMKQLHLFQFHIQGNKNTAFTPAVWWTGQMWGIPRSTEPSWEELMLPKCKRIWY